MVWRDDHFKVACFHNILYDLQALKYSKMKGLGRKFELHVTSLSTAGDIAIRYSIHCT